VATDETSTTCDQNSPSHRSASAAVLLYRATVRQATDA
jgi:hypothetical protein